MQSEKIGECLEALCNCGCDAVRATIESMEQGYEVPQASELSEGERELVLNELKAIMSVYDKK